jgi:hypothetical protein
MEDKSLPPAQVVQPSGASDSLDVTDASAPVSSLSVGQKNYPLETLEVHSQGGGVTPSSGGSPLRGLSFSRRKAVIVSLAITFVVILITALSSVFILNRQKQAQDLAAQLNIPSQDVSFGRNISVLPPELQGAEESLLVRGDIITRGNLKVTSGSFVSLLRTQDLTSNQTLILPNASGILCLDVNNCNYSTLDQLNQQTTVINNIQAQLSQIVVPPQGVTTLNNQAGAVSIQGSVNRVSVTTADGVITLSTPQALDANANVQFGNLALVGQISASTLQQTGAGNDLAINAGSDDIIFTVGGRTFQLPTSGPGSQVICTTAVGCGGGGGGSVDDVNGQTGSVTLQGTANQITVSTGVGTITFSTPQNINTTSSPTFAGLTLSSPLVISSGGTGLATTPTNGQLLIGNGSGYALSTLGNNGGLTITNGAGTIGLAVNYGSGANTAAQGNTVLTCASGSGNLTGGGNAITLGAGGTCNSISIVNNPTFSTSVTTPSLVLTGAGNNGTLQVANLGQATAYTLPDPGQATADICLSTGNCVGGAGGAPNNAAYLTVGNNATLSGERAIAVNATNLSFTDGGANGSYTINTIQNIATSSTPTFAGLTLNGNLGLGANTIQGTTAAIDFTNFDVSSAGAVTAVGVNAGTGLLQGTGGLSVGGAVTLSSLTNGFLEVNGSGVVAVGTINLGADTVGDYVATLGTLTGLSTTGNSGEGSTPTLSVLYGSSPNTAVQGNTSITVSPGTNLTGGGAITLGAGGTVTLNVASSPTFAGDVIIQGGDLTVGTAAQVANLVAHDGDGETITFTLPDVSNSYTLTLPSAVGAANQCLKAQDGTGTLFWDNCTGGGGGGLSGSGTLNRVAKFTPDGTTIGDSSLSDNGSTVTVNGNVNFAVQGTTITVGVGSTRTGSIVLNNSTNNNTVTLQSGATGTSYALTLPTAVGSANQCLKAQDGSGTLFWDTCLGGGGGGGITSLDGQTGPSISINNATGSGNVITIDDAAADGTTKGIASFNSTNFSASGGVVNTIQGISTSASPQFAGLTLTGNLNMGANTIQGTTAVIDFTNFDVAGNGNVTAGTYNGQTISSAASFTGTVAVATSVTTPVLQNSGALTIGTTATGGADDIILQTAGTEKLRVLENGNLFFEKGTNDSTLVIATPGQGTTYTLPDPGQATADICLSTGNCAGSGGGITGSGTNNTVAKFTSTGTIGNSSITDDGTTVGIGANADISGTLVAGTGNAFQVSAGGDVTAVGVNAGTGLLQGTGGLTAGGTITLSSLANGFLEVNGSGVVSVGAIDLGADTSGNYVATITNGNGITGSSASEGGTPTIALGPLTADWDQTGAFDIVLNNASSEFRVLESTGGTFYGTLDVGDLGADQTYTFIQGGTVVTSGNVSSFATTGVTAGGGLTGGGTTGVLTLDIGAGNGITVNANDITLALQANKGLEVDGNGLSLIDCVSGEILKYNGSNQWACAADNGGGSGDDISVNGVAATNANFLDSAASGTSTATTWGLNTGSTPDDITLTIGNASATDAGAVTTGTQTFAGAKTFNGQITAGAGVSLGTQTLLGGAAVIDFSSFDVSSAGLVTAGTYNGQTISSAANFTGTVGVATSVTTPLLTSTAALSVTSGTTLTLQSANGTTSSNVTLQSGNASAGATGSITIDNGTSTSGTPTINIGTVNSRAINIGNTTPSTVVTIQGDGTAAAVAIQSGASGTISIGTANVATKTVSIGSVGSTAQATTVNIANTTGNATQTVNIGATNSASNTVLIQGGTGASAISLQTGASGTISIGTANVAHTINVGNTGATGTQAISIGGSGNTANTLTLEAGTGASAIQIGNGATAHGIRIGTGAAVQTILIGSTNSTSTTTVQGGSSGTVNLATDGSNRLIVEADGDISLDPSGDPTLFVDVQNSRVGMGTGTPAAKLHIQQNNDGAQYGLRVQDSNGSSAFAFYFDAAAQAKGEIGGDYQLGAMTSVARTGRLSAGTTLTLKSFNDGGAGAIIFDFNGTEAGRFTNAGTLDVSGSVELNLTASTNNFALCHENNGATSNEVIKDCTGTPSADYMEMYSVSDDIETGDVLAPGTEYITTKNGQRLTKLVKTDSAYQRSVIGIASNPAEAGDFNSIGHNIKDEDRPYPVALNGRVKVKMSQSSPALNPGDYITASDEQGKATKATQEGMVIGKVLEAWAPGSGEATVLTFVNLSWYNPIEQGGLQDTEGDYLSNGDSASFASLNVSGATTLANLTVTGNAVIQGELVVTTVHVTNRLTVEGHIVTGNSSGSTTVHAQAASCGGIATLEGNDTAGTITIHTGAGGCAPGALATANFATNFDTGPRVILTPANAASASVGYYTGTVNNTSFTIDAAIAPSASTTYVYNYHVMQ